MGLLISVPRVIAFSGRANGAASSIFFMGLASYELFGAASPIFFMRSDIIRALWCRFPHLFYQIRLHTPLRESASNSPLTQPIKKDPSKPHDSSVDGSTIKVTLLKGIDLK